MISINNIDDIRKLGLKDNRALAEQWGVNIKGAKNLQEIHNILIEHWIKIIKINGGGRPSDHGIIKASRDQAGVRNKLCEKFQKTEILISKFPKKLRLNMKRSHPSLEHDFKDRGELLKKGECCVLVAGDDRGIQEFHQTIRLSDDNDDNPYEHIEVYYPLESLSEGIVIVDMPGIEGGSNVDQRLDKYLHSAFGFLYVINTNTAGGVQQSRTVVNSCDEFSPKSSLFIGNKWENVPDKDKKDVQEDVFKKLTAVYPGVRQHQLHYMSVNQAQYALAIERKSNSKDCMGRLNDKVEFEIFKINNLIKEKMLCEWDELECAGVEKRWKQTADTAAVKISERIARVMDGWQRENNILKHIDQEIINVFANEFGLLRHQVQDIEKFLTDSNHTNPMMKTIKVVPVKGIFSKKKGKMERTYNTLGGAISCIGMLDTGDKRVKKLFKDRYKDGNKTQGMAEATTLYLQSILEQKDIGIKLKKYFSRYFKEVDEAAKRLPVFLEVSIETVRKSNISEILLEDRTMRDLKHPNVVRYYGASNLKNDKGLKWIMVMELCADTLKGYYCSDSIDREKRIPGLIPNDHPRKKDAVNGMLLHALDICKGLEYIHEKGYTHRDMKLENVLIANDNTAKITDVGVAKATNILVRTCNGSPAYMAPEVLLSTKNQSNKIDIYSTSLVLWEMWFGKEITDDMNHEILGAGFQGDAMSRLKERQGHPRGGWRPSFRSPNRPPSDVAEIITRGWDNDPDKRPSGKEMRIFFEKKCTAEICSRGISSIRLQ
ncbi:STY13-like protein [Mya arenaria]|uniref:STY13-like protein n=1 Tax=Mya arenaria TaxID=6604 RepID=A0ABY7GB32_MYAAR|nr:STY13-like protein [Mya arenaria]